MQPGPRPLVVPWALLGGATVLWAVCFPLTNTDIWWHLAAGRWMLDEGRWLHADPFALGTEGAWVNLHWAFQLAALGTYRLGGPLGLVLAKAVVVALGAGVLVLAVREAAPEEARATPPLAALTVALATYLAGHLVLARPIVVTLVALALALLVLERFRRTGRARVLLWLVPLQVVWANAQGGLQLLGVAVVLAYLVGDGLALALRRLALFDPAERPRRLGVLALLVPVLLLCGLVTPYGVDGLVLPFKLLGRIDPVGSELFRLNVSENIPPWLLERQGGAPLEVTSFKWLAAATFLSFVPAVALRRRVVLPRLLLLVGLLGLALLANRNILLFNWIAGPILALNLGPLLARVPRARWLLPAVALAGLGSVALHRQLAARQELPLSEPAPFRVPDRAMDRLARFGLAGPLRAFTSVRYGGYAIWRGTPKVRPTIDGRLVLRSAARFAEHLDLVDRPALFEDYRRHHRLQLALLPTAFPERYLPLVVQLHRDPAWRLVYTDGTQTLFVHRTCPQLAAAGIDLGAAAAVRGISAELGRRFGERPEVLAQARRNLGRLTAAVGEHRIAAELLGPDQSVEGRSLLARVLYMGGQPGRAEQLARASLARHGDTVNDLVLLAQIAADRGRTREAVDLLGRALERAPRSAQALQLLARIRRGQQ